MCYSILQAPEAHRLEAGVLESPLPVHRRTADPQVWDFPAVWILALLNSHRLAYYIQTLVFFTHSLTVGGLNNPRI